MLPVTCLQSPVSAAGPDAFQSTLSGVGPGAAWLFLRKLTPLLLIWDSWLVVEQKAVAGSLVFIPEGANATRAKII